MQAGVGESVKVHFETAKKEIVGQKFLRALRPRERVENEFEGCKKRLNHARVDLTQFSHTS